MVDNTTSVAHVVFVLGGHEESPYCIVSLKVNLYTSFVASVPNFFTKFSYVWHYYVYVLVVGALVGGGTGWVLGDCMWAPYVVFVVNFN